MNQIVTNFDFGSSQCGKIISVFNVTLKFVVSSANDNSC